MSIESGPKSCCAHQLAAYLGLGAGSEVLSLLTAPRPTSLSPPPALPSSTLVSPLDSYTTIEKLL